MGSVVSTPDFFFWVLMFPWSRPDERQNDMADAASSEGKSPAQRMAMFADLLAMIDSVWAHLPADERRRLIIADQLHRRPERWWRNLRAEAQPSFSCKS
jgi:hypothetical protein